MNLVRPLMNVFMKHYWRLISICLQQHHYCPKAQIMYIMAKFVVSKWYIPTTLCYIYSITTQSWCAESDYSSRQKHISFTNQTQGHMVYNALVLSTRDCYICLDHIDHSNEFNNSEESPSFNWRSHPPGEALVLFTSGGSPGAVKTYPIVLINLHKTYPNSADKPP